MRSGRCGRSRARCISSILTRLRVGFRRLNRRLPVRLPRGLRWSARGTSSRAACRFRWKRRWGGTHLRTLELARAHHMQVRLLLFFVATPEICIARVARRVLEGGHNVPEADVRRRFVRSIANFADYVALADHWTVFDNARAAPLTAAEGRQGCLAVERDVSGLPQDLSAAIRALPACAE